MTLTLRPPSSLELPAAPRVPRDGPGPEHAQFCAARRVMLDRLGEWLATDPPPADAEMEMEIEGTVNLVRGLMALMGAGR